MLKNKGGDSLTIALRQLKVAITEVMDPKWTSTTENKSTFAYVQRDTEVGIFEYHNAGTALDEERIPHHNGFVPITQGFLKRKNGEKELVKGKLAPASLENFKMVLDSKDWDVPCIFDIEKEDNREYVYSLLDFIKDIEL